MAPSLRRRYIYVLTTSSRVSRLFSGPLFPSPGNSAKSRRQPRQADRTGREQIRHLHLLGLCGPYQATNTGKNLYHQVWMVVDSFGPLC